VEKCLIPIREWKPKPLDNTATMRYKWRNV